MLVKIVTKKRFKVIAMFMAVNLLAQIGFPTVAFALTSGPSQPEVGSFEPVNTNQMVDLFSGDFTYNIPLMNVPGPNGGYPINLAYHAGIGMEQEASWVGLGWNINAGAINRNLRGIPDDFNGDAIEKTVSMKPQRKLTIGVGAPINLEVIGLDATKGLFRSGSGSIYMYYDNYKGVGIGYGISLSTSSAEQAGGPLQGSLSLTSDSKEGLGVSPSLSFAGDIKNKGFKFETGLNFNSRQGLSGITFKSTLTFNQSQVKDRDDVQQSFISYSSSSVGAGTSFSASTYVPMMDMPRGTYSGNLDMKLGFDLVNFDFSPLNIFVQYSENRILENKIDFGGYGVMYAQNNPSERDIADFNREKDIPVNKKSKNLPIPSATNDIFAISGQGVGGAFKAHRSDIGVFQDPKIETTSGGGGLGGEFNAFVSPVYAVYKTGANPVFTHVKNYSGKWKNQSGGVTNYYQFKDHTTDNEFEPFYFKALGETVSASDMSGGTQNNNELPFRFELGKTWDGLTRVPVAKNQIVYSNNAKSFLSGTPSLQTRQKRVQSIEYLTHKELGTASYSSSSSSSYTDYPAAEPYNISGVTDHHIGQLSIVNPDGNRYVYGLPAYNTLQEDVSFSVNDDTNPANPYDRIRDYNTSDASIGNDEGLSNLYSKTKMPPYAHSYLLTAVLSADYVDLTNDGPTEDDLGYWVKFNYLKKEEYKWRAPYEEDKGNNIENKISDKMDDMSGYSYGEKEIMYLESIETKTHTAIFYLSEREDGVGVIDENGGQGSDKLLKLDKIVLKSKANLSQPIKTVHFKYDYSLCDNIPNNTGNTDPKTNSNDGGKLTLKNVWFTYFNNETKGELSPYEFAYSTVNPNYDINKVDRWGNYQAQGPFKNIAGTANLHPNFNHPYCNQFKDYSTRHADASAWNLTQITMPSGGVLNIDYESDDYAYVQNRKAMQMFKIIGTGTASSGIETKLSGNHQRIYIELDTAVNATELAKYVSGIDEIYFKTYMKLKSHHQTSTPAYDYVEGYAKFEGNYDLYQPDVNGKSRKAWIKVRNVPPHQLIQSTVNPIKMAGLREIRFNRSDLLSGQNTGLNAINSLSSIVTVVPTVISTVKDAMQMLVGFYNYGIMGGWCDEIVLSDDYPSYLRLNNPTGKKYGGGCRVKQVVLNDNWEGLNDDNSLYENAQYGQVYDYTLEDGVTSSGVAEYEPLIGGEENPFRRPVRFSSDRMILKDEALMVEEPFNESLFPSANVGYSRVTVRNIIQQDDNTEDVNKAVRGIVINEFYTARDFPVITSSTGVDYEGYNVTIPIPFIGAFEHHNNGYSQGYSIELNNMHGKPYSVATYTIPLNSSEPKPGTPGAEPVAATYYHYKTQEPFVRNKPTGNKLSNSVEVLTGDAAISEVEIGKHVETYVDMRENKTNVITAGVNLNVNLNIIFIPPFPPVIFTLINVMPAIDNSYSMFRSVATNKVITRNGILDKQETTKEGTKTSTQNVYYDGETGSPLLTTVTNDFDKPIYDYTYAAHWEHEGMQGAYKNIGAIVSSATTSLVRPGDELIDLNPSANPFGERYWVEDDGTLKDEDGNPPSPTPSGPFKIARSGYRNQQTVPMGNIISLTNPVTERIFPMFAAINSFSIPAITYPITPDYNLIIPGDEVSFEDCLTFEEFNNLTVTITDDNEITIKDDNGEREGSICGHGIDNPTKIVFPSSVDLTDPLFFDVATIELSKHGSTLVKAKDGTGKEIWGELINGECLNECLDGVLHASATKYKSSWLIDYKDAVPSSELPAYFSTYPNDITTRFGADNIWRLHESFIFNVTREQTNPTVVSNTQTGIDGTYESFGLFNWSANAPNVKWVKANQINQYSPYGFELESQDALEIKSAALYGYSNSLATAVASNTEYRELAFDGFEDYNGTYYTAPTTPNYGHIKFTGTHSLVTTEAHTGNYSMQITNSNVANFENDISTAILNTQFTPDVNREYYVSAWVKLGTGASASLTVTAGSNPAVVANTSSSQQKIEGWQRLELKFSTAGTVASDPIVIEFEAVGGTIYLDDVRVQPFVSNMKTFVYDPLTLWLKAELDGNNYATIYNYDEEGNLVQIKKETKAGMRTIVSNRKNIKKNTTLINP